MHRRQGQEQVPKQVVHPLQQVRPSLSWLLSPLTKRVTAWFLVSWAIRPRFGTLGVCLVPMNPDKSNHSQLSIVRGQYCPRHISRTGCLWCPGSWGHKPSVQYNVLPWLTFTGGGGSHKKTQYQKHKSKVSALHQMVPIWKCIKQKVAGITGPDSGNPLL